ncbi:H-NS family nucleoid-associated regulatory protein [Cupriavidus sp. WS]|uniref:H-NS histone family protein n=1 Tax=Cupriavidus sp. WS TaxID=1312922 RepID=UPI00037462A4|nr:H-NS family nucleoid-associated regulatory protein [Cupriavidus sp. WS]
MSVEIERLSAIIWVRERMAAYGLTIDALAAAGCFPAAIPAPIRTTIRTTKPPPKREQKHYRNADGQTWDGHGAMPHWLQRAVNAGQSIEHFRAEAGAD